MPGGEGGKERGGGRERRARTLVPIYVPFSCPSSWMDLAGMELCHFAEKSATRDPGPPGGENGRDSGTLTAWHPQPRWTISRADNKEKNASVWPPSGPKCAVDLSNTASPLATQRRRHRDHLVSYAEVLAADTPHKPELSPISSHTPL